MPQSSHCDVNRFLFVLSLNHSFEWEWCNFFKWLFKLFTFQPLSENLRINFLVSKLLHLYNFFYQKCELLQRLIAAWSGLVCISVSSARQSTTYVAWTAACLCEIWWTRLQKHYYIVIRCDNLIYMWRLRMWRCSLLYAVKSLSDFTRYSTNIWNELWLPVHFCLLQSSLSMSLHWIGKIGWHLIKL